MIGNIKTVVQTIVRIPPVPGCNECTAKTFNFQPGETFYEDYNNQEDRLTTYNGTYFICGERAYPWLPYKWTGSCYLGYVIPYMHYLKDLANHHRIKRALTGVNTFFAIAFPRYGVAALNKEIIYLRNALEEIANDTADALYDSANALLTLSAEAKATRTIALQNRVALDYLLAEKGGTCALIGQECCTYIPDSSENITDLVYHIRKEVEKLHSDSKPSKTWAQWFGFTGWGPWILKGLIILLAVCITFCCLVVCFKTCCQVITTQIVEVGKPTPKPPPIAENEYQSSTWM